MAHFRGSRGAEILISPKYYKTHLLTHSTPKKLRGPKRAEEKKIILKFFGAPDARGTLQMSFLVSKMVFEIIMSIFEKMSKFGALWRRPMAPSPMHFLLVICANDFS